jgi:biotin-dependent carboxylase-like uncharacterized protein
VIEVLATGPLATVQDRGRPGRAALGVGSSGAADQGALRLANRLLANAADAAAIEVTFGGLALRFQAPALIACTGASGPIRLNGRPIGPNSPIALLAGDELVIDRPAAGLRTYLGVRGGVDVPPVLGSRSTDLLSGIGPAVLAPGDRLPIGRMTSGFPALDVAAVHPLPETLILDAVPGPRDDWFTAASLAALAAGEWTVSPESNRIGVRLDGPPLRRRIEGELPSEGVLRGAVQVPPNGRLVLFLADHPVTGGYPVIAVVGQRGTDLAAQARPGDALRFRLLVR